ncbi:MAG: hypothetical protein GY870_06860 [archaeon]|nr:hypothetical protein [archaeon]
MDRYQEYLKKHKAKRLRRFQQSPLFKDLQEYGKTQGEEWNMDNGKSNFKSCGLTEVGKEEGAPLWMGTQKQWEKTELNN